MHVLHAEAYLHKVIDDRLLRQVMPFLRLEEGVQVAPEWPMKPPLTQTSRNAIIPGYGRRNTVSSSP